MAQKDTLIFEYKRQKSGRYTLYLSLRQAYSHDADGGKIGETATYKGVMEVRDEMKRMAKRSNYKFESHRL